MDIYPSWLEFVRFLGLDPVTVWVEYQAVFFVCVGLSILLLLALLYLAFLGLRNFLESFHMYGNDRFAFFKKLEDVDAKWRPSIEALLGAERFHYAIPATVLEDVEGYRKSVGFIVLADTRLFFLGRTLKGKGPDAISHSVYPLNQFRDANIKDGVRGLELKLVYEDKRPAFKLLGINRELGQEFFMGMHALRLALKEQSQKAG
jgi:hypothetical protein